MRFTSHEISDALRESLIDKGIVDRSSWKPNQDYFELPIEEGPILGLAQKAYDMKGFFHVGCVADERPPNFSYVTSAGSSQTKKGMTSLNYRKDLRLKPFFQYNAFHKKSPILGYNVRDLDKLSEAFNERENCKEEFGIHWNGWSGMYSPIILSNKKRTKGLFHGTAIGLEFENGLCTGLIGGVGNILKNREPGFNVPFHKLSKGTKLEDIVRASKDKIWAGSQLHSYDMEDVKLEDLMTGILQVAEKILPAKTCARDLKQEIIEACSEIKMAPKDYKIVEEHVHIGD